MTPLLVLADTHALAAQYAQTHQLGHEELGNWQFIRHPSQIGGLRDGRFVVVTGRKPVPAIARDQRGELIAALKRAGFRRIDP